MSRTRILLLVLLGAFAAKGFIAIGTAAAQGARREMCVSCTQVDPAALQSISGTSASYTTGNFSTVNGLYVDAGTVHTGTGGILYEHNNSIPCGVNGSICTYVVSSQLRTYAGGGDRITISNSTGALVLGSVGATTSLNASTLGMNFTTNNMSGNVVAAGSWTYSQSSTLIYTNQSVTAVADDGAGTSPAFTVNVTPGTGGGRNLTVSCLDANGCTMTLTESSAVDGQVVCITNRTAGTVTLADSAAVQESSGTVLGQWDVACFIYVTDRWVQSSAQNN